MKKIKDWLLKNKLWVIVGSVIVVLLVVALVSEGGGIAQLAGTAFCDTTPMLTNPRLGMVVAPNGMFVRTGPDATRYGFVDPGKKGIPYCSMFEMQGRNTNGTWLFVNGAGLTGWIKYDPQWQMINMNIIDLPVTEAILQPLPSSGGSSSVKGVSVSINNNIATVGITGLPANKAFSVKLQAPGGKTADLGNGTSDSSGYGQVVANMPANWPSGTSIVFIYVGSDVVASQAIQYSR
jgi:hypothetical protein